MERPPYIFQAITHFSIVRVEKRSPRNDSIAKLTVESESKIPSGRYPLILIKPFPPFGRPCEDLTRLTSLDAPDIKEIWTFRQPDDDRSARVEIHGKTPCATMSIACARIEGVPGWDGKQPEQHATE